MIYSIWVQKEISLFSGWLNIELKYTYINLVLLPNFVREPDTGPQQLEDIVSLD